MKKNTLKNFIASLKKGFGIDFFFLVLIFKLNTVDPIKLWNRKTTVIILNSTKTWSTEVFQHLGLGTFFILKSFVLTSFARGLLTLFILTSGFMTGSRGSNWAPPLFFGKPLQSFFNNLPKMANLHK